VFCHCYLAGHTNSIEYHDSIFFLHCRKTCNSCIKSLKLFLLAVPHVRVNMKEGLADSFEKPSKAEDTAFIPLTIEERRI